MNNDIAENDQTSSLISTSGDSPFISDSFALSAIQRVLAPSIPSTNGLVLFSIAEKIDKQYWIAE